jgi:acetyltransferase-like isoleucine patch superfamily enzyme
MMDHATQLMLERFDPIKTDPSSLIFQPVVTTRNERISIGARSRIDAFVKLEGGNGLIIKDNVHIASFCHLNIGGGSLVMMDGSSCGSGTRIITGGNKPEAVSCSRVAPEEDQILSAVSVIMGFDSCCYAGVTVVAKKDLTIGNGARIAAGSVLLTSVGDHELWAGNPAKKIGTYVDGKLVRE